MAYHSDACSLTQQDLAPCAPSTALSFFLRGYLVSRPSRTACPCRRRRPPLGTWRCAHLTDSAVLQVCGCTHAVLTSCMPAAGAIVCAVAQEGRDGRRGRRGEAGGADAECVPGARLLPSYGGLRAGFIK